MASLESASSTRRFSRKNEDFKCEICSFDVKGSGYTDHCPNCLYGKHVDINPGDRKSDCHGIMKPIRTEFRRGEFLIYYKCKKCRKNYKVGAAENDNKDLLFELAN